MRILAIVVLAGMIVAAPAVGGVGLASAQEASPALNIGDTNVDPGESANVGVSMSSAPDGLAGYDITLGLENDSVATITNATVNEEFGLSLVNISEDNTSMTVRLRGLDFDKNIEEGATNISLADVEVEGASAGETTLEVQEVTRVDDDSGNPIDINTDSGQITVEAADGPDDGNATPNLGIRLDREHVTAGDETAASVVLSEAPEGVAGFNITLGVDGEEVTIVATSAGDSFDLAVTDTDADAAMIRGLDFNQNVQAGAENVTLATAYVRSAEGADGTTDISITDVDVLESDEAESINATTSNATLEVHNVEPIVYNQLPIDADADGLYEDIDGNGEVNRNDAQIFFREFNSDAIQGYDEYDFNQDGKLSYSDIVALRNYM